MMKRFRNSVLCVLLTLSMLAGVLPVEAAEDTLLTLRMAKISALANSTDYETLINKIELKKVSKVQAIKSIKMKQKNMATFRWTPLLSFKFPEKPNLSEEYEFQFKPIQIQTEIDSLNHQLTDMVLTINEEVSTLYVDIVVLIETIAFNEMRLAETEKTLAKNRPRVSLGLATESDIEKMEKEVKTISEKIANDKSSLDAKKKKLSTKIGMDVNTGYRFENPMLEAEIPRKQLKKIIQHTLDNDQKYYDASMNATTGRISVDTNYKLMSNQYGGKMGYISGFVTQALTGQKVNGKSFRSKYDEMLTAVDKPWAGKIRILFIKIPKEWFKGQISGIRYVEDEPYALYEAVLEYQNLLLEKQAMKEELTASVEDGFNNLISMKKSYLSMVNQVSDAKEQLDKDTILNRIGELTYEEYKTSLDDYETLQNDMYKALSDYSQQLYSYDRLTCGAITAYMEETGADLSASGGGISNKEDDEAGDTLEADVVEGATYYLKSIVQEMEFEVGINIPDDFELSISEYELWCDDVQIGKRVAADESIRHLGLSVDEVQEVKIRLYDGEEFIDDCVIDPDVETGPLNIVKGYLTEKAENLVIGTFTMDTNAVTNMVTIQLSVDEDEEIGSFLIMDSNGNYLVNDIPVSVEDQFTYLPVLSSSMEDVVIEFYGTSSDLKYTGYFDMINNVLIKNPEEV